MQFGIFALICRQRRLIRNFRLRRFSSSKKAREACPDSRHHMWRATWSPTMAAELKSLLPGIRLHHRKMTGVKRLNSRHHRMCRCRTRFFFRAVSIAERVRTVPGDIAKAFGGGTDFVMLGSMRVCDESAGEGESKSTANLISGFTEWRQRNGPVRGRRC